MSTKRKHIVAVYIRKPTGTEVCGRSQQETQVCSVVIEVSSQN